MDKEKLAKALRQHAEEIRKADEHSGADPSDFDRDTYELVNVLARIVEGKSLERAFGAPGDWGYSHPIGKALAGR